MTDSFLSLGVIGGNTLTTVRSSDAETWLLLPGHAGLGGRTLTTDRSSGVAVRDVTIGLSGWKGGIVFTRVRSFEA